MDYKYIEQLLERYFNCETTLQEEQILHSFFAQEDVPAHLSEYADMFNYEAEAKKDELGDEFDAQIMAMIEEEDAPKTRIVKMMPRKMTRQIAPFFKAAAVVAIALTIGRAAEHAIGEHEAVESSGAVAVDPYIKSADIQQALRIKDVNKAETKTSNDSIEVKN